MAEGAGGSAGGGHAAFCSQENRGAHAPPWFGDGGTLARLQRRAPAAHEQAARGGRETARLAGVGEEAKRGQLVCRSFGMAKGESVALCCLCLAPRVASVMHALCLFQATLTPLAGQPM